MAITRRRRDRRQSLNKSVSRLTPFKNARKVKNKIGARSRQRKQLKEINTTGSTLPLNEKSANTDVPDANGSDVVPKKGPDTENEKPTTSVKNTKSRSRKKKNVGIGKTSPFDVEVTSIQRQKDEDDIEGRGLRKLPQGRSSRNDSPERNTSEKHSSSAKATSSTDGEVQVEVDEGDCVVIGIVDGEVGSGLDDDDDDENEQNVQDFWPEEEPPPPGYEAETSKQKVQTKTIRSRRKIAKRPDIVSTLVGKSAQKKVKSAKKVHIVDVDPDEVTGYDKQVDGDVAAGEMKQASMKGAISELVVGQSSAKDSEAGAGEEGDGEQLDKVVDAQTSEATVTAIKGAPPKSFYGNKASSTRLSPGTIQERLRALSFTKRDSFVPPQAEEQLVPRSRKVKKRVGIRARKRPATKTVSSKKTSAGSRARSCCSNRAHEPEELRDLPATILPLNPPLRQPRTANRFFKHHHPVSNVKVYYQGGILKVAPHVTSATPKGPIDFDHKENNISHVAEEGGKCDNFGLESVDDLERSGIIGRSSLVRDGLRKRKAPSIENKKVKRKRPSLWRYDDQRSPVKRIPAGLTLEQYEDSQIREKFNFPNVWIRLQRLPEPKPKRKRRPAITPKRLSMDVDTLENSERFNPSVVIRRIDPAREIAKLKKIASVTPLKAGTAHVDLDEAEAVPASSPLPDFAPASPCSSTTISVSPMPMAAAPQRSSTPHPTGQPSISSGMPPAQKIQPVPSQPIRKKYNPAEDAFGFDNIDTPPKYRVRKMHETLLKINSPEKRPKELTPKMTRSNQPTISAVLKAKASGSTQTSDREDDAIQIPSPFYRNLKPEMTSTPFDPVGRMKSKRVSNFYGKSSTIFEDAATAKQKNPDGFSGFKRLLDRLGKRQLQIDAGQERFGATACGRCGMIFSQGEAEDERQHERFHKQMLSAVRFKGWKTNNIVDVVPELGSVYLVSPHDVKSVRDKIDDVVRLANHSIGFDWDYIKVDPVNHPNRRYAVFAANSGKLASIVAIEPWTKAVRTVPGNELLVEDGTTFEVSHCVMFAWTLPPYRRRGLASRLLFHLRVQLAGPGNEPIDFDRIAFSEPTPDLHKFVKGLTERETYLVAI